MPKVRCASCKNYVDRDDAIRNGVQSVCQECGTSSLYEKSRKPPKSYCRKVNKKPMPDGLRDLIFKLDGGRCRFCGTRNDLEAHHVVYRSQGGPHEQSNLITLCTKHHGTVHSDKKRYMPLCLGVIWLRGWYGDKRMTVPRLEKLLDEDT